MGVGFFIHSVGIVKLVTLLDSRVEVAINIKKFMQVFSVLVYYYIIRTGNDVLNIPKVVIQTYFCGFPYGFILLNTYLLIKSFTVLFDSDRVAISIQTSCHGKII